MVSTRVLAALAPARPAVVACLLALGWVVSTGVLAALAPARPAVGAADRAVSR
ncbi:hypothetical protein ND991_07155 [Gordonia sputi]|uniref:hypothetical protein n=1 Tax=Gordonia sputi TaxID=36823 RepID=UPI002042E265|nr:hypothetical protein [Gordonia sputi]MCM3894987.1 hypothetical protein [Gordonia sputi]